MALSAAATQSNSINSIRMEAVVCDMPDYRILRGLRVVVVEDEGITQLQIRKMLQAVGADVVGSASNGRVAVETVLRERPDLVLMDIHMPIMGGLEASEQILASLDTCIVFLTAYSDDESMARASQLGASGYVLKPVTKDTLLPRLAAAYAHYASR